MTVRPSDGNDEPEAVDQVMLAVLSNRARNATALSVEQERLLDDWVADRLDPQEAAGAAALTRQNTLAAERVLERRLLQAVERSPPVPQSLAARILRAGAAPKASDRRSWWRSLGGWQWTAIAGAVVLASIVAIVSGPILQRAIEGGAPVQIAMATITDRSPLFEPSDIRMRGTAPSQGTPADQRFRDVEVPTSILRPLLAAAEASSGSAAVRLIGPYLPNGGWDATQSLDIFVDSMLKQKLEADPGRERLPIRIYDLNDSRAADIRRLVGPATNGRAYLLTQRP